MKKLVTLFFILITYISANAVESQRINLDPATATVANDLWHPEYGELDIDLADELSSQGLELSQLNPVESTLWSSAESYHEQKKK